MEEKLEAQTQLYRNVTNDLTETQKEVTELIQTKVEKELAIQSLEEKEKILSTQVSIQEAQMKSDHAQVEELKRKLAKDRQELASQKACLEEDSLVLEKQRFELTEKFENDRKEFNDTLQKLEVDVETKQQEYNEKVKLVETKQQEYNEKEKLLEQQQKEFATKLEAFEQEKLIELQKREEVLDADYKARMEEVAAREHDLFKLNDAVTIASRDVTLSQTALTELQTELTRRNTALRSLEDQTTTRAQELALAESALKKESEGVKAQKAALANLEKTLELEKKALESQQKTLMAESKKLENQKKETVEYQTFLENKETFGKKEAEFLEKERVFFEKEKVLAAKVQEVEEKVQELGKELTSKNVKFEKVYREKETLTHELTRSKKDNSHLRFELDQLLQYSTVGGSSLATNSSLSQPVTKFFLDPVNTLSHGYVQTGGTVQLYARFSLNIQGETVLYFNADAAALHVLHRVQGKTAVAHYSLTHGHQAYVPLLQIDPVGCYRLVSTSWRKTKSAVPLEKMATTVEFQCGARVHSRNLLNNVAESTSRSSSISKIASTGRQLVDSVNNPVLGVDTNFLRADTIFPQLGYKYVVFKSMPELEVIDGRSYEYVSKVSTPTKHVYVPRSSVQTNPDQRFRNACVVEVEKESGKLITKTQDIRTELFVLDQANPGLAKKNRGESFENSGETHSNSAAAAAPAAAAAESLPNQVNTLVEKQKQIVIGLDPKSQLVAPVSSNLGTLACLSIASAVALKLFFPQFLDQVAEKVFGRAKASSDSVKPGTDSLNSLKKPKKKSNFTDLWFGEEKKPSQAEDGEKPSQAEDGEKPLPAPEGNKASRDPS